MSKSGLLTIIAVFVVSLLGLVYLAATWDSPEGTTTVVIAPPVAPQANEEEPESPGSGASRPANSVLPQIRIQPQQEPPPQAGTPTVAEPPVEVALEELEQVQEEVEEPGIELPSLNASDLFVFNELRGLQNGAAVVALLAEDQIIRKFVVFVENISRGEFPQTGLPYRAIEQEMSVRNIDENLFVMEDAAHARFDAVVDTFTALDPDAAMALYRLLQPLFQQAYAEIGFRDSNFDATLRSAIANVIETADVEGPYQLIKPSVMYVYADASIENLQEVHKQLIRLGPDNTAKLKSKLQEFLDRL